MADYEGDSHELVNHTLVPRSQASGRYLVEELMLLVDEKPELKLRPVVENIPDEMVNLLKNPEEFIGKAEEKALEIARKAENFLKKYQGKEN